MILIQNCKKKRNSIINTKIIWIPGHLGFTDGNELADQAADLIADENFAYKNELSVNDAT